MGMSASPVLEETPRALRYQQKIVVLAGAGRFIDGFDVSEPAWVWWRA